MLFSKRPTFSVWEVILLLQSVIDLVVLAIWVEFFVIFAFRVAILVEIAVTAAEEKGTAACAAAS